MYFQQALNNVQRDFDLQSGSGTLQGKITDENSEPVPFANIAVEKDGKVITGGMSDFDGNYKIKPIPSGIITVKASSVGYKSENVNGLKITQSNVTFQNFSLTTSENKLDEVRIMSYKVPLIARDQVEAGGVVYQEDIDKMPGRSSATVSNSNHFDTDIWHKMDRSSDRESQAEYYAKPKNHSSTSHISHHLQNNVVNLQYDIDIPYSILGDNKDYLIKIKEVKAEVRYVHYATPKIDKDVFLVAELTQWQDLNLLSGKANLYYQGTYTGNSYLDLSQAGDTLNLSLGRDHNIMISRTANKSTSNKQFLGNNVKQVVAWDISIRNQKKTPIFLIVKDQYPISEYKSTEIESIDASNAKVDSKKGLLTWELNINGEEKAALSFKYSIKYLKGLTLDLE